MENTLQNRPFVTLIMAPLQGFTDRTFRSVYARHFKGIDYAVAPFISTMGQHRLKPSRIKDVSPELNTDLPVVPQILSNNAHDFIFLANTLYDMGYDTLNWNLGCPHSKIAKKRRGSGLLPFPEVIDELLDIILSGIHGKLSVKTRLGRKESDEIFNLLPILERYPLHEMIIHPRTGIQMYTGSPDHDIFGRILSASSSVLTYNGDIIHRASFDQLKKKFPPVDRIMIGRGLLSNPFLAEEIKGITVKGDKITRIRSFHDDLLDAYSRVLNGPGHLTGRMKGFWTYLGPSFTNSRHGLKKILKSDSLDQFTHRVDEFFQAHDQFGVNF